MSAEALAKLLKQKFPGPRKAQRTAPAWMPAELADVYKRAGAGAMIAPHFGRVMTPAECKARKALMDRVDKRGEWFGATWMPFTEDASGGSLCFDTKTSRLIYVDAPTTGEPPKVLASSVAVWLKLTLRALAKVHDPPDPDEDDYLEDEQEGRFDERLRELLLRNAKPAAKPKPRADVPPRAPPPDEDVPKALQFFTTFEVTKEFAVDGLSVGRGIGTESGKTKLVAIGRVREPGKWPKSVWSLTFHRGHDYEHQGHATIVLLDVKRLEAFVTFDDHDDTKVFLREVDRALKKIGFRLDLVSDPAARKRMVRRWQTYFDG